MKRKRCSACKQLKRIGCFSKNNSKPDGLHTECKTCNAAYRKKNAKSLRERKKREYSRNKATYLAYRTRPNIKRNRKEYMCEWRKNNKEKIRKDKLLWAKRNRDKMNRYKRNQRDGSTFSEEDEKELKHRFNNKCFNCSGTKFLQIDHHISLSKGGQLSLLNAVLLCKTCNGRKTNLDPEQFYTADKLKKLKKILHGE